jgi:hypothetical protein
MQSKPSLIDAMIPPEVREAVKAAHTGKPIADPTEPRTEAEIMAAVEERSKRPCSCCQFPLGVRKVVERIEMAGEGQKPVIESLHETCYEYVKTKVETIVKRERERKAS